MVAADYVHRIGRTGRAGIDGDAISLVCVDERPLLADIEQLLGKRIEVETVPGFAPDPTIRPEPIQTRGQRSPRRQPTQAPRANRPQRWDRRPKHQSARPAAHGSIGRPMSLPGERLSRSA